MSNLVHVITPYCTPIDGETVRLVQALLGKVCSQTSVGHQEESGVSSAFPKAVFTDWCRSTCL